MTQLPITRMTLYKHGVGFFQRRGPVHGESIKLTFRREEMADVLKSLTVLDYADGQVRGVDYDTPQNQEERLSGCSVILNETRTVRDLVESLRGRQVVLQKHYDFPIEGILVGLDEDPTKPLAKSLVSILHKEINSETKAETEMVVNIPLKDVEYITLRDETALSDLHFFLQTAVGQETHRSITIRLSPDEHDLEVSYIAPAPTWRVSYRLVMETKPAETESQALLQGWGIFDNQLEEDLQDIALSLTAGMPISFRYDLYTPHTPTRPLVEEEDRTAAAPIMFDSEAEKKPDAFYVDGLAMPEPAPMPPPMLAGAKFSRALRMEDMDKSVTSGATGKAMGELFQYNVSAPVTVGRGQSAMVPIVSSKLACQKDLIFNGSKMPVHPVATLRFKNSTNLTLERGPVTVLENGEYVGEAVLAFTADQAEAVISYAVELGVHVKTEVESPSVLESLSIENVFLVQHYYDITRTVYQLDNRTAHPKTILIEHELSKGHTIFDTPEPTEKTLNTYRYAVEVLPGRLTSFTVQQRCMRENRVMLQYISYQNLQKYFKDNFLDKRAYQELKALLDKWAEMARLQNEITAQEKRRDKIYKAQEQAQKNMQVLSQNGEEGALRSQYVKQLSQSEAELSKIDQAILQLQAEIKQREAEVGQMIDGFGKV